MASAVGRTMDFFCGILMHSLLNPKKHGDHGRLARILFLGRFDPPVNDFPGIAVNGEVNPVAGLTLDLEFVE